MAKGGSKKCGCKFQTLRAAENVFMGILGRVLKKKNGKKPGQVLKMSRYRRRKKAKRTEIKPDQSASSIVQFPAASIKRHPKNCPAKPSKIDQGERLNPNLIRVKATI